MDVTGEKVVLTGAFSTPRDALAAALTARGAIVTGSLSAKTELLVAGERAGSKCAKAERLGVPIIGAAELEAILAAPATVAVAPKPKKPAALPPDRWRGQTFSWLEGRTVCVTGTLESMTRAELKALIEASGGKLSSSLTGKTSIVISGDKWGDKVRQAIARDLLVYSEGELLLSLEDRSGSFPEPRDVPDAATLRALPVLESGELTIDPPPKGARGPLVLKWDKVAFTPHRRFLELHGFSFAGDVQYVGSLYHDGAPLAPADLFQIYGAESWRRALFWENGSDFADEMLKYDGTRGFNCTPLVKHGGGLTWEPIGFSGSKAWRAEFSGETRWFGDVCHDQAVHWLLVDLEKGQFSWNVHTGPYIISPDEPWGQ